ncbi:hypothetical protein DPEC_G00205580 [Dallia pectoralis]|uniref:Uncharacterized protein n=1 Tax=Dallia pectoralis TaxID=75939 RepID=A0ACC2G4H7_DALPE|nr:hypothetical protein DPEC_G00205580 [Dallia pectoralis]
MCLRMFMSKLIQQSPRLSLPYFILSSASSLPKTDVKYERAETPAHPTLPYNSWAVREHLHSVSIRHLQTIDNRSANITLLNKYKVTMAVPGGTMEILSDIPHHVWKGLPDSIRLSPSAVDRSRIGVWASRYIPRGRRFGPFLGEKKKGSR